MGVFVGLLVKLLGILFLLPYMFANLFITSISLLKGLFGRWLSKVLGVKMPENEKKKYEKVFTIVWILVAITGVILMVKEGGNSQTQEPSTIMNISSKLLGEKANTIKGAIRGITILQAIFTVLSFRSGANLSKSLIYRWHDSKVLGEYTNDDVILSIVGKATGLNLVLEGWFLLGWVIFYKITTSIIKGSILPLKLWLYGLVFGVVFGLFMAKGNKGILLRNEISVVLLFTAKETREKVFKLFEEASLP